MCVCVSVFFLCVCVFVLLKHTSWTSSLFVSAITTSSLAGVLNHPPQVLRCSVESAPPSPSPSSSPDGLAPCLSGGERGGSARERVLPREGNLLRTRTLPSRWTAPARRPHHAPLLGFKKTTRWGVCFGCVLCYAFHGGGRRGKRLVVVLCRMPPPVPPASANCWESFSRFLFFCCLAGVHKK